MVDRSSINSDTTDKADTIPTPLSHAAVFDAMMSARKRMSALASGNRGRVNF